MPQRAKQSNCLCAGAQDIPRTVSAQRALGPVDALEGDLETLALLGTQLGDALITTRNGAALITGKGGYAPYQPTSAPLRLSRSRVNLRIAPDARIQLYCAREKAGVSSLIVATSAGEILHRIVTRGGFDELVVSALDTCQNPSLSQTETPSSQAANIISLAAIRSARATWQQCDTGEHLNDMMADRGVSRAQSLPHVGQRNAWQVVVETMPSFMTYLIDKRIGHARLVPGTGLIQGDLVRGGTASLAGAILLIESGVQRFALDLDQIAAAWVTRLGVLSQLELYDEMGQAIAVIAADPMSNFTEWNTLLASLPTVSFGLGRTHGTR